MLKMLAFDLDGTLGDTLPLCIEAFGLALSPYVGKNLTLPEITHYFGLNEAGMIKKIVGEKWTAALADFYAYYEKMHAAHCPAPFPAVVELLDELQAAAMPLALITGKGEHSCALTLRQFGLTDYFTERLTGAEHGINKAAHLADLLQRYHLQTSELAYIGDTVTDVNECRKVGVTCYSAAWAKTADLAALKKINPDYLCPDIAVLRSRLLDRIDSTDRIDRIDSNFASNKKS